MFSCSVVFFSQALEEKAEKGDVGLWKFIVPQDSDTCMAAGLARKQQICSKILKFIFTSLLQDEGNCSARDLGGGDVENLNHG